MEWYVSVGAVASFVLPFFNIPLILRILKRKSSDDISLTWVIGVWICVLLITPAALLSEDIVFKIFGFMNLILFSVVAFVVLKYRTWTKKM